MENKELEIKFKTILDKEISGRDNDLGFECTVNGKDKAASDCSALCLEFGYNFAEWATKYGYWLSYDGDWYRKNFKGCWTKEQLINEYLKTLNNQPPPNK